MYTDPISDYLTRIRNAAQAKHKTVLIPFSRVKQKITEILLKYSFIADYSVNETKNKQGSITIRLKYVNGENVISGMKRISRPGIRRYISSDKIPRVMNGLGISIISTSKGLMTGKEAKEQSVGGEIICNIW